ncbi:MULTISPECIES: hypothetical protein [Aminobacterium]|jgi:hypothetical protein|uniref:hypothetical protein n=1 Tax=Aminobacterium TaxID=81466 RepID=UPI00257E5CDA|nr:MULTISPECIES: hypothetical protein [unclassified Aminobacterium]
MLNWIGSRPLRKPLAVYAAVLVGGVLIACRVQGVDVPPNTAELLKWFGGITLAAYYASSSYEATKKARE